MRFTFNEVNLSMNLRQEKEKLRNYKPIILNKNVSAFGQMVDKSMQFWQKSRSKTPKLPL